MFNRFISNYFGFNREQRNGLWVLLLISFTLLLVRIIYPYFMEPARIVVQDLPLIERRLDSSYKASSTHSKMDPKSAAKKQLLFVFDPNTVSPDQLLQLGFDKRTANTLLKFRSKGALFKEKKDLRKVYGISDQLFTRLEPYIMIKASAPSPAEAQSPPAKAELSTVAHGEQMVELNTADSISLITLNGIGPGYAKRILKYRSLLGGYAAADQLKEVYGFSGALYEKIRPLVTVNTTLIKKINLNRDDFKTINKHPYLSYGLTKIIFDWRRKTIINPVNLKDILNDDVLYRKLLPYLVFD